MAAPKIYRTDIPDLLIRDLQNRDTCLITAPTGLGKTVMLIDVLAHHSKNARSKCIIVIPTRPAILAMHEYASKLFPDHIIGYRMRDKSLHHPHEDVTLMVSGYFLEYILHNKNYLQGDYTIGIDEAHEVDWSTDLLIRLMIWSKSVNPNLKLILSSATLDIIRYKSIIEKYTFLSVPAETRNVDMHFIDAESTHYTTILTGKLRGLSTLIVADGEDHIYSIIERLGEIPELSSCNVYPLHSKLSIEEISLAVNSCQNGWTIIVSTNIVENAITIKGLRAVIDFGHRKICEIVTSGATILKSVLAAKSNIIQSTGRVGRESHRGIAYVMMIRRIYDSLNDYPPLDVYTNPLYRQIITLIRGDYPIEEVLNDVKLNHKLILDTEQLVRAGFVKSGPEKIQLTDNGLLYSKLNLSLNAGSFLVGVLNERDASLLYPAIVIAAYMDVSGGIFYRPKRAFKEDADTYARRVEETNAKQSMYIDDFVDTIETALAVWFDDPDYGTYGLYSKNMLIWKKTVKRLSGTLTNLGYSYDEIPYPSISRYRLGLLPYIIKTFKPIAIGGYKIGYHDMNYPLITPSVMIALETHQTRCCDIYSKLCIISHVVPGKRIYDWVNKSTVFNEDIFNIIFEKLDFDDKISMVKHF